MMTEQRVTITRATWSRLLRAVTDFANCELRWRARGLFALLIMLLFAFNGLNVLNSYVGRDFITAISIRDSPQFTREAVAYVVVFAASALVGTFYSFSEQRLDLLWRQWLTGRLLAAYLDGRAYYRLSAAGVLTSPDERIAEDVRAFTATTLSFVLMLSNATVTVVAFSGVLWSISRTLFMVAVLYAACGSALTVLFGRPLVWLNYNQLDKEADFRANLVHVQQNAESIALLHREATIGARLQRRFDDLVANMRRTISVNRNLAFFTNGYNYLIQIIPALLVAPLFFRGEVEFGVITQSAMAFSTLVGALSLVVTQFQSISSFAAVVARLGSLVDAMEHVPSSPAAGIEVREDEARVAYERLTLVAPGNKHALVTELSVSVPRGTRLLIVGPNDAAKVALFRATAGIWESGRGRIVRPGAERILFLPERPYLPPGTLREVLLGTGQEKIGDEEIRGLFQRLGLDAALEGTAGLDVERDWDDALSLGEQHLLSVARVILATPHFVFLDRLRSALEPARFEGILKLFSTRSITYLTIGNGGDALDDYDVVLEIANDGSWTRTSVNPGREGAASSVRIAT
jgi:vitamin B12/bleomycin/antimicrobial peptide transport system ATP-binding/permease protein